MMQDAVNLTNVLDTFDDLFGPRTVAEFDGHDIMVTKLLGEFVPHTHADSDDVFLVLRGRLEIRLPDRVVEVGPGELFVVPRGVEHQPCATEETHLLLIEPTGTPNTGDPRTAQPRCVI